MVEKDISAMSVREKLEVAENPETAAETLRRLSTDWEPDIRAAVARNTNTPTETLTALAGKEPHTIREPVAADPNTPTETLERLAGDWNSWVRQFVAENPSTPAETLESMTRDNNPYVRLAVAGNPNTPEEARELANDDLEKLWETDADHIRETIADEASYDRDATAEELEAMANHRDGDIRVFAAETPTLQPKRSAGLQETRTFRFAKT